MYIVEEESGADLSPAVSDIQIYIVKNNVRARIELHKPGLAIVADAHFYDKGRLADTDVQAAIKKATSA
jgi:hypothetical protein